MSNPPTSNKSLYTNLVAAAVFGLGLLLPEPTRGPVVSMGLFALSGALTNWIAVHMLFERVPGLYGSGIIPLHFEAFKEGIHHLMMQQFFTLENINRLFGGSTESETGGAFDLKPLLNETDFSPAFEALLEAVQDSPLSGMLTMVGGAQALEPLREPFQAKLGHALGEISESEAFQNTLKQNLVSGTASEEVLDRVSLIVSKRLEELTPEMVKEIIQQMIRQHLGWLVVWGGVFGALIGLLAGVISI